MGLQFLELLIGCLPCDKEIHGQRNLENIEFQESVGLVRNLNIYKLVVILQEESTICTALLQTYLTMKICIGEACCRICFLRSTLEESLSHDFTVISLKLHL